MLTRRLFGKAAAMMAGTGGLPPRPLNAPAAGQVVSGVQPGVSQAIVLANKVIVFGTGGGVFVYSGTPGAGNPPISWMSSSTTDPYGNTLPSTTGVAGAGTFEAGDMLITPSGQYVYSGTPGAGNLIYSVAPFNGSDPFGNTVFGGTTTYTALAPGGPYLAIQTFGGEIETFTSASASAAPGAWTSQMQLGFQSAGYGLSIAGPFVSVSSPLAPILIAVEPGTTVTPETWHAVTVPAGMTGNIRVMILPLSGMAVLDVNVVITSNLGAVTTYTGGTLPAPGYYPQGQREYPLAVDHNYTTVANAIPRVVIPISGDVLLDMPGFSSPGASCIVCGTVMYPVN
jgi:hypothetical protein